MTFFGHAFLKLFTPGSHLRHSAALQTAVDRVCVHLEIYLLLAKETSRSLELYLRCQRWVPSHCDHPSGKSVCWGRTSPGAGRPALNWELPRVGHLRPDSTSINAARDPVSPQSRAITLSGPIGPLSSESAQTHTPVMHELFQTSCPPSSS